MKKQRTKRTAEKIMAFLLVSALVSGTGVPGISAFNMPVGEAIAAGSAQAEESSEDIEYMDAEEPEETLTEDIASEPLPFDTLPEESDPEDSENTQDDETRPNEAEDNETEEPLAAVADASAGYTVTRDDGGASVGTTYDTLAAAVSACPTGTACTITAIGDDTLSDYVSIPSDKEITLTSLTDGPWTITQTATTTSTSAYTARHFYVQGSLTLDNIILSGTGKTDSGTYNGGVYVYGSSAKLMMRDDAVIEQCSNYNGGGVYVGSSSALEMTGGEVSRNEAANYGGGMYVGSSSAFGMTGGEVSGNEAVNYGGGVYVTGSSSTFEMAGGEVSGNEVANYGGGVYVSSGTFEMAGGEISENEANRGGGVYVTGSSTFEMTGEETGGEISENDAINGGGVYVNSSSTFEVDAGEISGNEAGSNGGGVYVYNSSFEMSGGEIGGNEASNGGGVYVTGSSSTFEMTGEETGGEISENEASYGGGVYVNSSSAFEMTAGEISGNEASYGGGVYVNSSSTFEMTGGEISGNEANSNGGGVYVTGSSSTFEMAGGEISGNEARNGGGVYVSSGTFEMTGEGETGGEISENEADYGGGVRVGSNGTFKMAGGEVSENKTRNGGGGVYVGSNGTFEMTGGEISGNQASSVGGGVHVGSGMFEMDAGEISENEAGSHGGGVYVSSSTFEMTGGEISGNEANSNGGGVYVDSGAFEMAGGEVSGNEVARNGGGVYVASNSKFEMTDSLVTGNTASGGGGIYTADYDYSNPISTNAYSNITIGDNAQVTGNTASAKYGLPVNYAEFSDSFGELLNNDEINYKGNYLVQYDANNGSYGSKNQEASSGTGSVEVTLLTESETGFTAPDGKELAGWNTKESGDGTGYNPGETITIDESLTLYAVWEEPGIYIVTKEADDTLIGTYHTLAEAVDACLTTEACVITATQDDEIDAYVTIPSTKEITLTSSTDGTWTITQTATTTNISAYTARHFYVQGILTLENIILSGMDNTDSGTYNGGVYVSGSSAELTITDDAVIKECSNYNGGGVYVYNSSFEMGGGEISGNEASYGGGVFVRGNTFEMIGGEISGNEAGSSGGGVYVGSSSKFEMIGGEISGNEAGSNGGGVYVVSSTFEMEDGEISGNEASYGGGVYVSSGIFEMTGGEIGGELGGNVASSNGGGVYVLNNSSFEMIGGEISENEAGSNGGGVYVNYSSFEMIGGEISGNVAGPYGGGAYVYYSGFEMSRGEISGNEARYGGGVYVVSNSSFEMSGQSIITGNTATDGGGIYAADNSYENPADTKKYANISIDDKAEVTGNTASAKYGLPVNYADFSNFPGELLNNDEINYKGNYLVQYDANNGSSKSKNQEASSGTGSVEVTLLTESETGFTAPDGKELTGWNTKEDGDGTGYDLGETITIDDSLTLYAVWEEPGIYIVTKEADDTLIGTYHTLAEAVNACLTTEACVITATQDDEISARVSVPSTKEITLTSSSDGPWTITQTATTITSNSDARHFYVEGGSLTLDNIILSGTSNNASDTYNGGVYVYGSSAELTMTNDAVIKQCSRQYGGGVYVSNNSTFKMTGGEVSGNEARYGGGVYVNNNSTFEMAGGEVSGNEAITSGGGVYVSNNSTFEMAGGEISGNKVGISGGGVCIGSSSSTFEMAGGEISGNEASNGGGVFVTVSSTFEMAGGEISGNEASISGGGGGVYVSNSGTFNMTDGIVAGNTATDSGGGVLVYYSSTFEMAGGEVSGNEAKNGGGVYVTSSGTFEMTGRSIITGNTAKDGGGIYTADNSYENPADSEKYANISIGEKAKVTCNTASARYGLPVNYAEFSDFPGKLLNNNEINYKGPYLVQYDANNGSSDSKNQEASSGTGNVSVTLLTDSGAGFTAPAGKELTGWNTRADGNGTGYGLGETITIDDSITLYAVWGQSTYTITETYYTMDGTQVQEDTSETVTRGETYEKTAPVLTGYRYLGYQINGGALQPETAVTIQTVDKAYTVTYLYEVYAETISVSVPVKLLWAANESDGGDIISPDYYFYNHSSHDISVTLEKLTVSYDAGLNLVGSTIAGSGSAEVALQLDPVLTSGTGWWQTNRVSLTEGPVTDGLLGKIKAGEQGYFDLTGTYGGSFDGFDLMTGAYLQPEYEAVFRFELTH